MTNARDEFDMIVMGGGPAGARAAITAVRHSVRVLLLERGSFPRHKVCGEFISAESLHLLHSLLPSANARSVLAAAPRIKRARIFIGPRILEARITPVAASLARFTLDEMLWQAARQSGVECRQ